MMKVAVIGAGSMGKNHVRVYNELPETELVSVSDFNPVVLKEVCSQYRVNGYLDYHEMLEKEKPDAVSVVVPTRNHTEVVLAALDCGAHVLVEKPIAPTLAEAHCMIERTYTVKRQLMVGHIARFNPALISLKARLEAGEAGKIYQIACRRIGPFPSRVQDVGVVIDLAPHDLDLMRYLVGLDPVRIYAEIEQRLQTEHEDLLNGVLRFPGGITATLEINWLTPTKVRQVQVLGEKGFFLMDDLTQDLYFYENDFKNLNLWRPLQTIRGVGEGPMIRYAIQRREPLMVELKAFINAVEKDEPVPVNGEDGLTALRLALLMVKSGNTHQVIDL